ncbi:glutathione S-transferase family protein [Pseudenhygromyxa sp. WMMC2535]|nr:glutathione S-transferase family protein [Pseudenhygromyxa sp. WMMC2535]
MRLYDNNWAPSPRRVRIFLAEKDLEVELVPVDLGEGGQFAEPFASRNPFQAVPVLELEDGRNIAESQAICRYLEHRFPTPPLMGRDAVEVAQIEMWTRRVEIDGYLQVAAALRHSHPAFAGRAVPGVREGFEQIPALVDLSKQVFARMIDCVESQLGEHPFVAGENFSVADIVLLVTLDFAKGGKRMDLTLPEHTARWYEEISARPSASA